MNFKKFGLVSGLAALATGAFAQASLLGGMSLDYHQYKPANTGPFDWYLHGDHAVDVDTYCMSTLNDFSPTENPQDFIVYNIGSDGYTLAGADGDSTLTGILDSNKMFGSGPLNDTTTNREHFMESVWFAETYGPALWNGDGSLDPASGFFGAIPMFGAGGVNDYIHQIEDGAYLLDSGQILSLEADASGLGNGFWYLQQNDPSNYSAAGQPQGIVFNGPGPHNDLTPEPFTIALSLAGLGLAARRRRMGKQK